MNETLAVTATIFSGVLEVAAIFVILIVAGYLVFAHEGWGVFLLLNIITVGVYIAVAFAMYIFGGNLKSHDWLINSIVGIPWAGMAIYQAVMIASDIRKKRDAEPDTVGDNYLREVKNDKKPQIHSDPNRHRTINIAKIGENGLANWQKH